MSPRTHRHDPVLDEYVQARIASLMTDVPRARSGPVGPETSSAPPRRSEEASPPPPDPPLRAADSAPRDPPQEEASPRRRGGGAAGLSAVSTVVSGRVADALAAAPAFLRAHLVVVAAVLGLGVVVTGFVVSQTRTSSVAVGVTPAGVPSGSESAVASSPGATPIASGSPSGVTAPTQISVHVLGSVAKPGIVQLPAGSRVADALTAAGGLTANADPAELNLAAVVPDGSQIVIGTKREPRGELNTGTGGNGAGGAAAATGAGTQLVVDLNSATQAQLEALPGIGAVTATRILEWRQSHGRFNRIDELQEVSGIGEKTFQQLAPYVRV